MTPKRLRTNIDIEESLWERARDHAAETGASLTFLVNLALAQYFHVKPPAAKRAGRPRAKKPAPKNGKK